MNLNFKLINMVQALLNLIIKTSSYIYHLPLLLIKNKLESTRIQIKNLIIYYLKI